MARRRKIKKPTLSHTKKPLFDLEDQTKKAILAILFFSFAAIILLSVWQKAGPFGNFVYKIFDYLFGWGYFILPVVFLMIAYEFLKSRRERIYFTTLFGAFLLFVSVLGISELYYSNNGAGFAGYILAISLNKIFGFWASLILLISFVFISLIMTLNIPLRIGKDENEEEESAAPEGGEPRPESGRDVNPVIVNQAVLAKEEKRIAMSETGRPSFAPQSGATEGKDEENEFKIPKFIGSTYNPPIIDLLERAESRPMSGDIKANANIIRRTLEHFGIDVEMGEVNVGPTVTQYTLRPAQGVKIAKIVTLHNDLALALAAHPLRIEAPIPGKALVGIEVPNKSIALVRLGSLLDTDTFKKSSILTFALGRDVSGVPVFADLSRMPHLLIAGATGSGKSVSIHSIITSLIWRNGPGQLKFILIDPKRVELAYYRDLPHLLTPVLSDGKKSINALRWAVKEMEQRYEILSQANVRDILSYNNQVLRKKEEDLYMPYLVIVIDELADLMAAYGREVEGTIIRLAQMARAVGIHLIVSTQRPSVEVLTGLIKANITSRMALQVPSQIDSRTILDMAGAEKLLGNGDMLYLAGDASKPRRLQGVYILEKEIKKIVDYIVEKNPVSEINETEESTTFSPPALDFSNPNEFDDLEEDELLGEAKTVILQAKKASASLLQRRLSVGYARAARLLDILEEQGYISPGDGAKPREVYSDKFNQNGASLNETDEE
ncbi:MAG: DNA translocase FtsK 4TM domain-containing protein [Candidatus Azambacteria bacterium]|nr:DNA translocase FtsK 4TM domain-containing protein [Candidatus Azambacteria bacterium]